MLRNAFLILLLLTLAACGGGDDGDTFNPDSGEAITWDRSPGTIVFRMEVVGGEQTFDDLNDVPYCTIYGDNRIVWTVTAGDTTTQILYDVLTDQAIRSFVSDMTIAKRLFEYEAGLPLQPPSDPAPVVEQITINVAGRQHVTDGFGGWDYNFFEDIRNQCVSLSPSPTIYEPTEAWLTVQASEYDPTAAEILWDAAAADLDLAAIASSGEPAWITGGNVRFFWNRIHSGSGGLQFTQDGQTFLVALQVPNVTRDAPQPPDA